jgi:cytoskeletal protein RodZ
MYEEPKPVESNTINSKPSFNWKLILIAVVIAIVIAGIAIGVTYYYMNQQANNSKATTDKQIAALQTQVAALQKTQTTTATTSQTASPDSTTQHYLQISQWGVKIPISGAILNLTIGDYSNYSSNGAAQALVNVSIGSCSVGQINKYSSAAYQQGNSTRQSSDADYNAKKIDDNYYFYSYGTTSESVPSCTTQAIETQIKTAVVDIQAS